MQIKLNENDNKKYNVEPRVINMNKLQHTNY